MRRILLAAVVAILACGHAFAQAPTTAQPVTPFPLSIPGQWFKATGNLDNSTDVSIAAAATGTYHCVTSVSVVAIDSIAADTIFRILSADTVIWQWVVNTTTTSGIEATFPVPICTVAGEALEVDVSTDPADDLVYYNIQGYSF